MPRPAASLAAAVLAAIVALPAFAVDPKDRGVWWEQTMEMEMAGAPFAMPPQTMKVCQPAGGWEKPPTLPGAGEECRVTDFKRSGNKVTWRSVCEGDEKMTAEGEMVQSGDRFTGVTTIRSSQGVMKMKTSGRKLGGECDAGESRRMAEANRREAERAQRDAEVMTAQIAAASCDAALESMNASMLSGKNAVCKDPAAKARFCKRLETREGFAALEAPEAKTMQRDALELCDRDLATLRARWCERAVEPEDLGYIGERCPDRAQAIAMRECAGRKYTAVSPSYQRFCYAHASHLLATENVGKASPQPARGAKQEAAEQGKKVLKGLFGR